MTHAPQDDDRIGDELLVAYADGELDDALAGRVESALESDPALRAALRRLVEAGELARGAFAAPGTEPLPEALVHLVRSAPAGRRPSTHRLPAPNRGRSRLAPGRGGRSVLAASLALVAGIGIGGLGAGLTGPETPHTAGPWTGPPAEVGAVLDTVPGYATVETSAGTITVLDSFLDGEDRFCRAYTRIVSDGGEEAVACHRVEDADRRAGSGWQTVVTVPLPPADTGTGYRPAAGSASLVDAALRALGAGSPLPPDAVSRYQQRLLAEDRADQ
jgi:hypothetical protein